MVVDGVKVEKGSLPACPEFFPTVEEFQNPIQYISSIRHIGEKAGICKIVPPEGWNPSFAVNEDKLRFTTRIQQLNTLEANSRVRAQFLENLRVFLFNQGRAIEKLPFLRGEVLNFYGLYKIVTAYGGYDKVTSMDRWEDVLLELILEKESVEDSRKLSVILKNYYCSYLLEFEQKELHLGRHGPGNINNTKNCEEEERASSPPCSFIRRKRSSVQPSTSRIDNMHLSSCSKKLKLSSSPQKKKTSCCVINNKSAIQSRKKGDNSYDLFPNPNRSTLILPPKIEIGQYFHRYFKSGGDRLGCIMKINLPKKKVTVRYHDGSEERISFSLMELILANGYDAEAAKLAITTEQICRLCLRGDCWESLLLCDLCDEGFHYFCLPENLKSVPKGDWFCSSCRTPSSKKKEYGFEQNTTTYNLLQFQEYAQEQQMKLLDKTHMSLEQIERKYWFYLLSNTPHRTQVEYGSDLDTSVVGSGFPNSVGYAESGWNLNNLPQLSGSLLKYLGTAITGVMVPWLYIGSLMSSFCWHAEDHFFYSISYCHFGQPKIWYGVPGSHRESLISACRSLCADLSMDFHLHLVTQVSPFVLAERFQIPVVRGVQSAQTFMVTFPGAYHAGFNTGFNAAEAVNFATHDWIPHGQIAISCYQRYKKQPVFSHEALLCTFAEALVKHGNDEKITEATPIILPALKNCTKPEIPCGQKVQQLTQLELTRLLLARVDEEEKDNRDVVKKNNSIAKKEKIRQTLQEENLTAKEKGIFFCQECRCSCFIGGIVCLECTMHQLNQSNTINARNSGSLKRKKQNENECCISMVCMDHYRSSHQDRSNHSFYFISSLVWRKTTCRKKVDPRLWLEEYIGNISQHYNVVTEWLKRYYISCKSSKELQFLQLLKDNKDILRMHKETKFKFVELEKQSRLISAWQKKIMEVLPNQCFLSAPKRKMKQKAICTLEKMNSLYEEGKKLPWQEEQSGFLSLFENYQQQMQVYSEEFSLLENEIVIAKKTQTATSIDNFEKLHNEYAKLRNKVTIRMKNIGLEEVNLEIQLKERLNECQWQIDAYNLVLKIEDHQRQIIDKPSEWWLGDISKFPLISSVKTMINSSSASMYLARKLQDWLSKYEESEEDDLIQQDLNPERTNRCTVFIQVDELEEKWLVGRNKHCLVSCTLLKLIQLVQKIRNWSNQAYKMMNFDRNQLDFSKLENHWEEGKEIHGHCLSVSRAFNSLVESGKRWQKRLYSAMKYKQPNLTVCELLKASLDRSDSCCSMLLLSEEEETKLHCICQLPHVDNILMIQCGKCQVWYHPQCIGLPIKQLRKYRTKPFHCQDCIPNSFTNIKKYRHKTLYCLCRSSLDDEPMICCDFCDMWYHVDCISMPHNAMTQLAGYRCIACNIKQGVAYLFEDNFITLGKRKIKTAALKLTKQYHDDAVNGNDQEKYDFYFQLDFNQLDKLLKEGRELSLSLPELPLLTRLMEKSLFYQSEVDAYTEVHMLNRMTFKNLKSLRELMAQLKGFDVVMKSTRSQLMMAHWYERAQALMLLEKPKYCHLTVLLKDAEMAKLHFQWNCNLASCSQIQQQELKGNLIYEKILGRVQLGKNWLEQLLRISQLEDEDSTSGLLQNNRQEELKESIVNLQRKRHNIEQIITLPQDEVSVLDMLVAKYILKEDQDQIL